MRRVLSIAVVATAGVVLAVMPAVAPANARKGPHVCQGTPTKPGVLKGKYSNGVNVKGYCEVNAGPAHVIGTLDVTNGSVLLAAFGMHQSKLTVTGDLNVATDATLVLGCNTTSFPCIDDPASSNPSVKPTLTSAPKITGSLTSSMTLGVIVHQASIGGNVSQIQGGGGASCSVPTGGPFSAFHSPVYSAYEDSTITGNLKVERLTSCWLGIARVHAKNVKVTFNTMADPDAIEIVGNKISGNLACNNNKQHVWDSAEAAYGQTSIYPRKLDRNTVGGTRSGQCVKAGPLTMGGPPAGGPF
jgi:hypothetical protein